MHQTFNFSHTFTAIYATFAPKQDGVRNCEKVYSLKNWKFIIIIVLTGYFKVKLGARMHTFSAHMFICGIWER